MDPELTAWLILTFGYLLPLAHVLLSPRAGGWRPPPGSRCPLGPKAGWLVLVLLLGPFGWLMFWRSRRQRNA
ncbi:hypothetical protein [Pelagibius sp.]|uniref:hypothetical protein n=1 Tax=Pelagibius sp. TaxID=1931238 RepID=UPI00260B4F73|nr:hypothetical protein [Pelagibius sp.]